MDMVTRRGISGQSMQPTTFSALTGLPSIELGNCPLHFNLPQFFRLLDLAIAVGQIEAGKNSRWQRRQWPVVVFAFRDGRIRRKTSLEGYFLDAVLQHPRKCCGQGAPAFGHEVNIAMAK